MENVKPNRCNEWDCVHNKNGVCNTDMCPEMEAVLAIVHGRKEENANGRTL